MATFNLETWKAGYCGFCGGLRKGRIYACDNCWTTCGDSVRSAVYKMTDDIPLVAAARDPLPDYLASARAVGAPRVENPREIRVNVNIPPIAPPSADEISRAVAKALKKADGTKVIADRAELDDIARYFAGLVPHLIVLGKNRQEEFRAHVRRLLDAIGSESAVRDARALKTE